MEAALESGFATSSTLGNAAVEPRRQEQTLHRDSRCAPSRTTPRASRLSDASLSLSVHFLDTKPSSNAFSKTQGFNPLIEIKCFS